MRVTIDNKEADYIGLFEKVTELKAGVYFIEETGEILVTGKTESTVIQLPK